MLFLWLFLLLIVIVTIRSIQYLWARRHLYTLGNSLPGPFAFPIVGNGLKFLGNHEDALTTINEMCKIYSKPTRLWLGPILLVYFCEPEHIEKILSSTKVTNKHDVYDFLKVFFGDGLITSSGSTWRLHRKIIQPMLSLKFVTGYMACFDKHINICMKHLEKHANQNEFDIHDVIHNCFIDIIGVTVLGTEIGAQMGRNHEYIQANIDMYGIVYERITKPWLHPDVIYKMTDKHSTQQRIASIALEFNKQVIADAYNRVKLQLEDHLGDDDDNVPLPVIDQIVESNIEQKIMNDIDIAHHLTTLFIASQDTMTIITSFLCLFFGMCPQYQKTAVEEIRTILGEIPVEVSYDDIVKLQYLDMCVKETLRLAPIAPFILRKTNENFHLDKMVIPTGCAIAIGIFEVHRSPKHWANPETFFPDHFLPDAVSRRHPYAYIPFSAGPRSCIGKTMAIVGIKLMIVNILQRFEIEADGQVSDIKLKSDISVRSRNGYKVKLKKICWK